MVATAGGVLFGNWVGVDYGRNRSTGTPHRLSGPSHLRTHRRAVYAIGGVQSRKFPISGMGTLVMGASSGAPGLYPRQPLAHSSLGVFCDAGAHFGLCR